jgi:hypothetical protein
MVLLQTILILILVYYGVKLLLKWLAPKFFNYAVKKTEERFGQQFGGFQDFKNQPQPKRDTTTTKNSRPKANPSKKVGEYIDFEEIE